MANQLEPNAEWQRLHERYHAMSDEELLGLAAEIDDLTEVAADVLRREMQGRRMEVENPARVASFSPPDGPGWWNPVASKTQTGKSPLITFHDAMEASRAGDFLDVHEIGFEMKDYSSLNPMGRQVSLQLIVNGSDRERAMEVLREAMGLFPLQEVEVPDAPVDDGAVSTLGDFAQREDAEEVARILDDAHIWHRITANADGTVENEDCFTLEVREIDLMRAGELVERAMDLPEG